MLALEFLWIPVVGFESGTLPLCPDNNLPLCPIVIIVIGGNFYFPANYLVGVLLNVSQPLGDVVEGLGVGDVVDQHDAHRAAVVGRRDGVEPLLTGGVPNLKWKRDSIRRLDNLIYSNRGLIDQNFAQQKSSKRWQLRCH